MATYTSSPRMQFFTSSGVPLVSGTLTVYSAGTTTLSTIYSTVDDFNAQTNAITNPITLDSRGECQVVLSEASKFLLKDSSSNTIWTIDDVTSNTGDILDINGNELVKFTSVASAVNEITIANAATGNNPSITASGNDTNVSLTLNGKGTGTVRTTSNTSLGGTLAVTGAATMSSTLAVTTSVATPLIKDASGNTSLAITATASAVNYLKCTNSATGTNVILEAAGTDTDIGITSLAKAAGQLYLSSTHATSPVKIYNGTSYQHSTILAFANTAANRTVTFPDADGTVLFSTVATQAEQETGSSLTNVVSSGRQQYHPSAAKVWAHCGVTGNILSSYNVTSITDGGTGIATVNYTTSFSSTAYCVQCTSESTGAFAPVAHVSNGGKATGSVTTYCSNTTGPTLTDPTAHFVTCFGDQ